MTTAKIGVDFGSTSIKLVRLRKEHKTVLATSASVPSGAIFSESTADREILANILRKLFADNNIKEKNVNIALPESQVFTRVIEMPVLSDEEVASALRWQAEQYIPLPLSEVNMDFSIISRPKNDKEKMKVLLLAAPFHSIERMVKILDRAGLSPNSLETEILSASRVFSSLISEKEALILVDCGSSTTDVAILDAGVVVFTHSLNVGGEVMTRAISENFSLPIPQAEEYKIAYGLEAKHLEGKVKTAIKPMVDAIVDEIKKAVSFYQKKGRSSIKSIIIFGGTSLLPGMVSYLAEFLEVEVQIANPWQGFTLEQPTQQLKNQASIYTVATGLALRE